MTTKHNDLTALDDAALERKAKWYEARNANGKHDDALRAIRAEQERREEAEADAEEEKRGSVVKSRFKQRYAERGTPRGNNDWLFQTLAHHTLDDNGKLDVAALDAIAQANGVSLDKYKREGNGWQGRLRMTAGLILRPIVAREGALRIPRGKRVGREEAPAEFVAAWRR